MNGVATVTYPSGTSGQVDEERFIVDVIDLIKKTVDLVDIAYDVQDSKNKYENQQVIKETK
jgi:hypothetical protein